MDSVRRSRRILVVDDTPDILTLITRVLDKQYTVTTAASGLVAIGHCHGSYFDLALIDVMMPGMDGLELSEKLRKHYQIPAVIISAHANDDWADKAGQIGALGYLVKPFTKEQLLVQVKTTLAALDNAPAIRLPVEALVEYAKGLVAERRSLNEKDAYEWLRKNARDMGLKVSELAKRVAVSHEFTIQAMNKPRPIY